MEIRATADRKDSEHISSLVTFHASRPCSDCASGRLVIQDPHNAYLRLSFHSDSLDSSLGIGLANSETAITDFPNCPTKFTPNMQISWLTAVKTMLHFI